MKLSVCYDQDGKVLHVRSFQSYFDKGLTEEKILKSTKEANENSGYERFKNYDVPQEFEEIFNMLLGEKHYKHTKDIEDILDSLEDVNDTISNVARDIYDASEAAEASKRLVEKLKEDIEKFMKKGDKN